MNAMTSDQLGSHESNHPSLDQSQSDSMWNRSGFWVAHALAQERPPGYALRWNSSRQPTNSALSGNSQGLYALLPCVEVWAERTFRDWL